MFTHHICRLLGAVELAGMRKRGPDTTQPILVGIDGAALRPSPAALGLPNVTGCRTGRRWEESHPGTQVGKRREGNMGEPQ